LDNPSNQQILKAIEEVFSNSTYQEGLKIPNSKVDIFHSFG